MKIKTIIAWEVLDSRAKPTVIAKVILENGVSGQALVPSGASTGSHEAVELRDGDPNRFQGAGVLQAVANVENIIAPALVGYDVSEQEKIDQELICLDGTANKSNLGANAILAVSLACARAAADSLQIPLYQYLTKFNPDFSGQYILPLPMLNILNGGRHANWATDIQEYMILPLGAKNMAEAIKMASEIYHSLKKVLLTKKYSILVGDEGGFAPAVSSNEEAFVLLQEAVSGAGYELGKEIVFAIDAAASEFYQAGKYHLNKEAKVLTSEELAIFYQDLMKKYPIYSLEDVFAEDDWNGFANFLAANPNCQVVGDDLYVTDAKRLEKGIKTKASNSILIKPNQIGTLTETIKTVLLARQNNFTAVISHRSGETEDTFIADLAVALGTGQIKTGAPARSERTAKYNRLIEIEHDLKDQSTLAKFPFYYNNI